MNAGDTFTVVGRTRMLLPIAKKTGHFETGWIDGGTVVTAMGSARTRQHPDAEWPIGKPHYVHVPIKSHDGVVPDGGWIPVENLTPWTDQLLSSHTLNQVLLTA